MSDFVNRPQPPCESEKAEAAYVWVRTCQVDLCEVLQNRNASCAADWPEIVWRFHRLEASVGMLAEAKRAAQDVEMARGSVS